MTFQPLGAGGGMAGWRYLQRTAEQQIGMVARDPTVARAADYFRANIGKLRSADDLVGDYRMLSLSLSAFGLEADINSRSLIRKVLESDLSDKSSLANRLGDKRYRQMAEAFGFGRGATVVRNAAFVEKIVSKATVATFEQRVGESDGNLRIALNGKRELAALAASGSSDTTKWLTVVGSLPLQKIFVAAFGLGSSFGKLPVDRQVEELKQASQKMLGSQSLDVLADDKAMEKVISRFLLRSQAQAGGTSRYNMALTLLTG